MYLTNFFRIYGNAAAGLQRRSVPRVRVHHLQPTGILSGLPVLWHLSIIIIINVIVSVIISNIVIIKHFFLVPIVAADKSDNHTTARQQLPSTAAPRTSTTGRRGW